MGLRSRTLARAAAALLVAAGCAPAPRPRASVVLVSIDTLRADRLGLGGYERGTSPRLDALGARGVVFERAFAESGWTLPSHVTMLTGLAPRTHGVDLPAEEIGRDTELVAERLRRAGARTFASTDGVFVGARHGFDRGFERFDDARKGLAAALRQAREFIASLEEDEPFFVFVHTYDVHCPYEPEPALAARFRSADATPFETAGRCGNPHFNAMELGPGELRHLSDLYDASIAEADAELGRFLDWLTAEGALEDTWVVVTSDHGEELGEHGQVGHEGTVSAQVLRIPLVIAGPGLAPRRVADAVGLADLAPTLLELVGLEPPAGLDGRSLAPLFAGAPLPERAAFSEVRWRARRDSVVRGTHHLIEDLDSGSYELYELEADPAERRDLAGDERARAAELRAELAAWRAAAGPQRAARLLGDPGATRLEELRKLGYAE